MNNTRTRKSTANRRRYRLPDSTKAPIFIGNDKVASNSVTMGSRFSNNAKWIKKSWYTEANSIDD